MYDKDNSGEIDLDEMVEIFCLMYAVQVLFRISLKAPLSLIFQGFFRIFENILILNISRFFLGFLWKYPYPEYFKGFSEAEATERAEKIFHTLDRWKISGNYLKSWGENAAQYSYKPFSTLWIGEKYLFTRLGSPPSWCSLTQTTIYKFNFFPETTMETLKKMNLSRLVLLTNY